MVGAIDRLAVRVGQQLAGIEDVAAGDGRQGAQERLGA